MFVIHLVLRLGCWLDACVEQVRGILHRLSSSVPRPIAAHSGETADPPSGRLPYLGKTEEIAMIRAAATSALNSKQYVELLWTLREAEGRAILLDLTCVSVVQTAFFRMLAEDWDRSTPTRLALWVTFDQWACLRLVVEPFLGILSSKHVDAHLFYQQQDYLPWFLHGRVVHNPDAVLGRLRAWSQLSVRWPQLLDAALSLLEEQGPQRRSESLVDLGQIALNCGAYRNALMCAHEALLLVGKVPNITECRARCILGIALMHLGQKYNGVSSLDDAITLGKELGAHEEAVDAAYHLGLYAAADQDYPGAIARFMEAIELLPEEPSEMLGRLHAAVAFSLSRQGKNSEAETHASLSYNMRVVSSGGIARELHWSQALLRYVRDCRKTEREGLSSERIIFKNNLS